MLKRIMVKADSVEETRKTAESQLCKGFQITSSKIIKDGKPVSIQAIAKTAKKAFEKIEKTFSNCLYQKGPK